MAGWLAVGAALLAGGCGREDVDRLGRIGRKAAARLEEATGGPRGKLANGWAALRGSLADTTPDSRVQLRLRWDKSLAGADVHVSAPVSGTVRLQGRVANLDQRQRAVGLAETTQGVEKVLDELTVSER
jgi:osmotically-inducible protein OsmY